MRCLLILALSEVFPRMENIPLVEIRVPFMRKSGRCALDFLCASSAALLDGVLTRGPRGCRVEAVSQRFESFRGVMIGPVS